MQLILSNQPSIPKQKNDRLLVDKDQNMWRVKLKFTSAK